MPIGSLRLDTGSSYRTARQHETALYDRGRGRSILFNSILFTVDHGVTPACAQR
jgi:hypothetical protein